MYSLKKKIARTDFILELQTFLSYYFSYERAPAFSFGCCTKRTFLNDHVPQKSGSDQCIALKIIQSVEVATVPLLSHRLNDTQSVSCEDNALNSSHVNVGGPAQLTEHVGSLC